MLNPSAVMAQRYMGIIAGTEHDPYSDMERFSHKNLMWMCERIEENADIWPADKVGRWLGFVQATLGLQGAADMDHERDVSRPLYHAFYEKQGLDVPNTLERT